LTETSEHGAQVRFPPPLVVLLSIFLGVGLRYAIAPLALPSHRAFGRWAGVAILLFGLGVILSARTLFKRTGQDPKPWKPSPELLLEGPYRFTRNPMYVGVTLIQFGLGLALSNLWISLLAPFSLLAIHFIAVVPEERYLTEKFGDSYKAFLLRVRRYL